MARRATKSKRRTRRSAADKALARRLLAVLKSGEDIRTRKARRTRAAIKVHRYENLLKLDVAISRMLDEVVG